MLITIFKTLNSLGPRYLKEHLLLQMKAFVAYASSGDTWWVHIHEKKAFSVMALEAVKLPPTGHAFLDFISGSEKLLKQQPCANFQSASLLRGTNLNIQFLLYSSSNPSCGQRLSTTEDIQNSSFNASLGTKIIIHGFRYKQFV